MQGKVNKQLKTTDNVQIDNNNNNNNNNNNIIITLLLLLTLHIVVDLTYILFYKM